MEYTQRQLEDLLSPAFVRGAFSGRVRGIASLGTAGEGDLSFLQNAKYAPQLATSGASIVLVPENCTAEPGAGMAYLGCKNPSLALARICEELERQLEKTFLPGIHPLAVIAPTAAIHVSASIGPFCEIGDRVTIGEDVRIESHCAIGPRCVISRGVRLHPRVTLYRDCELGERVIVHSGAVIGCDGYGYVPVDGKQRKLAHVGRTRIGEDVEIGANVTIDRARFAETRIGSGTKIDNLAHIAHNVTTGKDCLIVAQVGIAGSTELGDRVVLGGQVGVAGHLSIGSETQVGAQGGVASNLPAGSRVRGTPAMPISLANRFYVLRKRIPELFHRVDSLEEALGEEQGEA